MITNIRGQLNGRKSFIVRTAPTKVVIVRLSPSARRKIKDNRFVKVAGVTGEATYTLDWEDINRAFRMWNPLQPQAYVVRENNPPTNTTWIGNYTYYVDNNQ